MRLANSNVGTAGNGAVELVGVRTNAISSGDSDFIIRTASGATVSDRVKINLLGISIETIAGSITKPAGNLNINSPQGIINLNPEERVDITGNLDVTGNIVGSFPLSGLVTVSFTLTAQDRNTMIRMNSTLARTATIPANVFQAGDEVHFVRNNTGEVTISPGSGFTLNSEGGKRRIDTRYQVATVKFYSPTEGLLFGALKT